MLKIMEFVLLGASLLVIAGLVFAWPKSAPPADEQPPLGAADQKPTAHEKNGNHTVA